MERWIYKIVSPEEWDVLRDAESWNGSRDDLRDGYIHFSTAQQLSVTLSKHFANEDGLILLSCDPDALAPDLRWEPSRGGALFPHLYRALTLADVQWSRPIGLTDAGHDTGIAP